MNISSVMKAISGVEDLEEMKVVLQLIDVPFEDRSDQDRVKLIVKCDDGKLTIGRKNLKNFLKMECRKSTASEAGIC